MSAVDTRELKAGGAGAAIATMSLGIFLMGLSDMLAKHLTDALDPFQIVLVRNTIAAPFIVGLVYWRLGAKGFVTATPWLHVMRGVLLLGAGYTFFSALKTLGLAETTAIGFAAPIFITVLSALVLREVVGWRRWLAVLAGFGGVLIIVRPGGLPLDWGVASAVCAASFYSLYVALTRKVSATDSTATSMVYVGLVGLVLTTGVGIFFWQDMDLVSLGLTVLVMVTTIAAHGLMMMALARQMVDAD